MPTDPYASFATTRDSYGTKSRAVTPAATDINPVPKAVVCATGGDITVVPLNNADAGTITFTGVAAGFIPPFQVRRVTAATATVYTIED
jgi:hypothetical protein